MFGLFSLCTVKATLAPYAWPSTPGGEDEPQFLGIAEPERTRVPSRGRQGFETSDSWGSSTVASLDVPDCRRWRRIEAYRGRAPTPQSWGAGPDPGQTGRG